MLCGVAARRRESCAHGRGMAGEGCDADVDDVLCERQRVRERGGRGNRLMIWGWLKIKSFAGANERRDRCRMYTVYARCTDSSEICLGRCFARLM